MLKRLFVMGVALALLAVLSVPAAQAQQTNAGAPVTPTAQKADYAVPLGTCNGATCTVTINPPNGQFVYFTQIAVDMCTSTGAQTAGDSVALLMTGMGTANPSFRIDNSAQARGVCAHQVFNFAGNPLKSAATGTAVTIPATNALGANGTYTVNSFGYFAP